MSRMSEAPLLALIGAGNMGEALLRGLLARGYPPRQLVVSEPDLGRQEQLRQTLGPVHWVEDNAETTVAEVLILAVKPQHLREAVGKLEEPVATARPQLVLSIAAGVSLARLADWLGHQRLIRCMPNLPALERKGITALLAAPAVSPGDRQLAQSLLEAVGQVLWLEEESQFDAVTALSGSGPAYFFLLMEAMAAAAAELGLAPEMAARLTLETARGAAALMHASGEDAARWRERVTSPGGTTQAALEVLESGGFRRLLTQAVAAAARRSAELGRETGAD